ncbi:hypothetical protein JW964_15120, partial [candidate division KSB1 bacterium]|nr:hypothetical protein [candidate division KSB1 bacterium]
MKYFSISIKLFKLFELHHLQDLQATTFYTISHKHTFLKLEIPTTYKPLFVSVHKEDRICHSRMFLAGIHTFLDKWMPDKSIRA